MSTVIEPTAPPIETIADLLERTGAPPERILLHPPPGTATEDDSIRMVDGVDKRLCELVDGVLVEKVVGFFESRLAIVLAYHLEKFAIERFPSIVAGADGPTRFDIGLVRLPDLVFVPADQLPDGKTPRDPISPVIPALAVEIISHGKTRKEMERKLRDYFGAGVHLVWYVYPKTNNVRVYSSPDSFLELDENDTLKGGDVLPGFSLSIREWFERAGNSQK